MPTFLKREDLWAAVRAVHAGSVVREHELLSLLISFTVHRRFETEFL
jgi:hypothetical protein